LASVFNYLFFNKIPHLAFDRSFGGPRALRKAKVEMGFMSQIVGGWAMARRRLWYVIALSTLCVVAARITMAQEEAPPTGAPTQEQGPPPGAARISVVNGEVSSMRGDSGEWVAAIVNAPVMGGDNVATAARSRAEVQLDFANVLRMDQNADVKIADLTQKHIQLQVASGIIDYTVFKGAEADVEIDTPNMAVLPMSEGVYRIQIDADSQTELTVRNGRAQVSTSEGSTTVERGQVIYVRGTDNPEYQIANAAPNDDWDGWNNERDRAIEKAQSWQYANRYYTGAQDLDAYGQWENTPDYGNVWVPNVGPDWEPYYDGSWAWEPYWGWTWVSNEPWGWAPYHYGRWCWWGSRWCWWPGSGYWGPRPVWAPAYVSFLGFGFRGGFGLGFGFGSIGWCPLGPFDRAYGWWGHRNGYNAVGIANINNMSNFNRGPRSFGNVPQRYSSNLQAALNNPNIRRAITTVPADQFGKGMVRGVGRSVDGATLRQGQMVRGTLPVVPTRASLMPGNRLASPSAIPSRAVNNTRFYSKSPVPARTESFNQRAAQIRQMVQQHNPAAASNFGARQGANSTGRYGNAGGGASGGSGNANRPGYTNGRSTAPGGNYQPRYSSPQPGSNQGGWQGFSRQSQPAPRSGGWNAPAPRSQSSAPSLGRFSSSPGGQSYGGYGSRPSLNMRKPIVVERSTAPRSYGGGGGAYSAPSGGSSHSAPSSSNGGGGGSHGRR
jgi:hypothetical protein